MVDHVEAGFLVWVTRLVREHRQQLVGVARREGLLAEDALDVVQEALITFLGLPHARALANERDDSRKLLSVLVRNQARNRRRRHDRAQTHVSDGELLHAQATDQESVDTLIAKTEAHLQALGCVERLAEVQQRVVTLRLLEDHENAHVADLLGMTPSHVAVTLHRAKQALRDCMALT